MVAELAMPGLHQRKLILCMGPGGVGKTTCAAALACAAAGAGLRVAVLTVDPSRRLAQALGFADPRELGHELKEIEVDGAGALFAGGLDRLRVFDEIVEQCADQATAARIRGHAIYRATAERLGGALEYASMARVQILAAKNNFDLIVVDTPPAANALDFLRAPERVRQLVENPAARLLSSGAKLGAKGGRLTSRLAGLGSGVVLRTLERLAGGGFLGQLSGFLAAFAGVIDDFHRRGSEFGAQLRSPQTGALLVTSAAPFSVREAGQFLDTLDKEGMNIDGVVLNRVDMLPQSGGEQLDASTRAWFAAADAAGQKSRRAKAHISGRFPQLPVIELPRGAVGPTDVHALAEFGAALWG